MVIDTMRSAVVSFYGGNALSGWSLHLFPIGLNRSWEFEMDFWAGEVDIGCGPLFRFQRY